MPWRSLSALVCLLACAPAGAEPFRYPAGRAGSAELRHVHGLPVLTVAGTPEEIGAGVGSLALRPASRVLSYPRELCRLRSAEWLWGSFLAMGQSMYQRFPDDFRAETEAMARAARAERDLVIAGNTFFDVK